MHRFSLTAVSSLKLILAFSQAYRLAGRAMLGLLMLCSMALALQPLAHAEDEVAIPKLTARVTDLTGTLSQQDQAALENHLAQLEQQKGSQIAILLVPTTQPETVEQYALRVAEAWKLGRGKVDDGVLILLAKNDRKMRIEVGYGLEGAIPDVVAKRIIAEVMAPAFRKGDFAGGLAAAVDTLARLVDGESLPPPPARQQNKPQAGGFGEMLPLLLFGGLIVGGLLRSIFGSFLGGTINGGLIGLAVFLLGGGLLFALVLGVMAFIFTMSGGIGLPMGIGGGGFGGGSGGGGFSGGGGSFGGGGASGDW